MHDLTGMARSHPIGILFYLYRFLYLLLIPLLRGIAAALTHNLIAWLQGAWLDICILLLILLLAWLKWYRIRYKFDINGIHYTEGILVRRTLFISMHRISTLSIQQIFCLRPFRLAKLRIDTIALHAEKADLAFFTTKAEAERILALRLPSPTAAHPPQAEYRARGRELFFLSLFTSNSILGVLFLSTLISQAGQILGQDLYNLLMGSIEEIARRLAIGLSPLAALLAFAFQIPPIAAALALLLLAGWLVAFCVNLLQTRNLTVRRYPDSLYFSGGVLTRKTYSVQLRDVAFLDLRQSLLSRAFGLLSVFANGIGLGKEKSDIAVLIPFSRARRARKELAALLPEYPVLPRQFRPNPGAIMKFIIMPLWGCLLAPGLPWLISLILPMWASVLEFAAFMFALPAFWFLCVRLLDFWSSGLARAGTCYTIRYSKSFFLHTVLFTSQQLVLVNLRQSILQRGDGKCDVVISTRSESKQTHHLRNLTWADVEQSFATADPNPFHLKLSLFDQLNLWWKRLTTRPAKK